MKDAIFRPGLGLALGLVGRAWRWLLGLPARAWRWCLELSARHSWDEWMGVPSDEELAMETAIMTGLPSNAGEPSEGQILVALEALRHHGFPDANREGLKRIPDALVAALARIGRPRSASWGYDSWLCDEGCWDELVASLHPARVELRRAGGDDA